MARHTAIALLVAALAPWCSYSWGQGTQLRNAPEMTISKDFRGTLGTNRLSGFSGYSAGVPGRSTNTNYTPLAPNAPGNPFKSLGGVGLGYRVTGGAAGATDAGSLGQTQRRSAWGPRLSVPLVGAGSPSLRPDAPGTWLQPPQATMAPAGPLAGAQLFGQAPGDAGASATQGRFDLAGRLAGNENWRKGVELLKAGQYSQAAQEIRLGLIFEPGRAEGQWLMAAAQAAAGDPGDALWRLRNGLAALPDMLSQPRGICDVIGEAAVRRLIEAGTPRAEKPPTPEQTLVAAWLASETAQPALAESLLRALDPGLVSDDAVIAAIRGPAGGGDSAGAAVAAGPPAQAAAGAESLEAWLARRGSSMGFPPPDAHMVLLTLEGAP